MARINVTETKDFYDDEETTNRSRFAGWFDADKARRFDPATEWRNGNRYDINTNSEWHSQYLYRTAQGRWVLEEDGTRYNYGPDTYTYVADDFARDWLTRNGHDAAVIEHFGEVQEESGPPVGRPPVGPAIQIRLPIELLDEVDTLAERASTSRAEMIRELLRYGLDKRAELET